ncbi:MAG: NarK family nitrate/nitrite MFS transporter [Gammaproteobacteria bacterium]|nr:NarK family nitrate/nitrite MFS transporter [Gammaproteobacteria bacterium]
MSSSQLNLFSFSGNTRILHFTWFAFFLSFVMWFNLAPFKESVMAAFDLTDQQWKTLLILNIALTIPARIIIGMLVDKFGPRIMYSALLFSSSLLCFAFAMADSFEMMAIMRFLMGFVGAGFVIGIRMIGEWFPAKTVGVAEGVYGGWGNFGSAAAAMSLPTLALMFGGDDGWRYAIASTGVIALIYSAIYYFNVHNTPKGSTYFKPKKTGAMEVTSKNDFYLYVVMNIPMYIALAVLNWKLGPANLGMLTDTASTAIYLILFAMFVYQFAQIWKINKHIFTEEVAEIHRYKFKQVAVLNLAYLVTFGSELAVVSMLPGFFMDTFELTQVLAGTLAAGFAFMNLVARPGGGLFSDRFGRKKTLMFLLGGLTIGYLMMSQITSGWIIAAAVMTTMACSFFVQAGEGAVFAMVPLVKRRMTGQIAGMAGAYGNVGGVTFLTVYSFVEPATFFMVIAAAAVVTFAIIAIFMEEPEGHIAEVMPDGTVEMIEVS